MTETTTLKVLVCRPQLLPLPSPLEVHPNRLDFCWARDGEILTAPDVPCCEADKCGCGWSFAGVSSARATSWGVVERRSAVRVVREVRGGKHLARSLAVDGYLDHVLATIGEISGRIKGLPIGTLVGIWTPSIEHYGLYARRAARGYARVSTKRNTSTVT